jgi:hypothetical protein
MAGRGYVRTALTGCVAVAALFGSLAGTGSAAPETPAQAAERYIDDGRASARAGVLSLAPSAGALQLALGAGEVIAETTGGLSQASSKAADLGLIGSTLSADNCEGGEGVVDEETLPQPLVVDNRAGPTSADGAEAPGPIPGTSGGHKEVTATDTPSSSARVTFIDAQIPGVLGVAGGQAFAEAEVFPGAGREARSSVAVDVSLFGVVELRGLHWSARHRTPGDDAEGSFSIDALEILGVPVPVESVEQAATAINTVLLTLGLRIEMPEVVRVREGAVDFVRVTPLRVVLADSPVGELVVRPALDATREARSQLFDALVSVTCYAAGALLVGEIGLGVAAGSGSLIASIGGAEATTATVVIEDLFGQAPSLPPAEGETAAPVASGGTSTGTGGRPVISGGVPVAGPLAVPTATASSPGSFDRICENIHPERKPACSEGAAAAVGLAGLAATAAVGFLDFRRRRRPRLSAAPIAGAAS